MNASLLRVLVARINVTGDISSYLQFRLGTNELLEEPARWHRPRQSLPFCPSGTQYGCRPCAHSPASLGLCGRKSGRSDSLSFSPWNASLLRVLLDRINLTGGEASYLQFKLGANGWKRVYIEIILSPRNLARDVRDRASQPKGQACCGL